MVVVSENIGSAPFICSKVIRNCVSYESIWSEKGSSNPRFDVKSDANGFQSKVGWARDGLKQPAP